MPTRQLKEGWTVRYRNRTYVDRYGILEAKGYTIGQQIDFTFHERTTVIMDADKLVVYESNFVCHLWPIDWNA